MQMITAIRMFVLAMQHGSLAGAARQLGMSTASVSRQVGALETHLKVRLFNRAVRTLTPTEAGEMLLRRARPLLDEIDEMVDAVSLLESRPRGLLRVNIRGLAASRRLVPALPRFLASHPEVNINLRVSNDEEADLIGENIDVDIRYTRPDRTDLVARLLAPSRLALVASPALFETRRLPAKAEDLAAFEAILYDPEMAGGQWKFMDAEGQIQSFEPSGRLRVNDGQALRSAILTGLGVAMMPYHEVDDEIAAGKLVEILPELKIVHPVIGGEGIFAVYQKSHYQPGKLRSFLAFLPGVFAGTE
ncbi:LysR family transcriptional regulator [Sphingobium sp.]|uniref:LysR family transcriptional regulator n=1 Tax=Sphingobium sp. TaxID=1912891 RepID=UPI0035C766AA